MKKRSIERFREIVHVFASYGFGLFIESSKGKHKKSPVNLRLAIEELGPTFIKIGQILSTRSDILPKEYINELVKLQDSVPPEDITVLRREFETSINKSIEECFLYFNYNPLASASVSQVHEAILLDGRKVVVKIQRPDIYEKMKLDISILKRIVKLTRIDIKVVDPLEVLEEIELVTKNELDFIAEGENILRFKEENKDIIPVYVPELITDIWSKKVIVLEKISGIKINDLASIIKEGYDNRDIARKLALSYCYQIFDRGFFHADPHPGNILISNGKICFIDFGIMGEINDNLREWLNVAMVALATKDKNKVVDCILAIGIKDGRVDRGDLYEDISYLIDTYLTTSLKNIKISVLLEEVFNVTRKNNIRLPRELVILIRGLMILEGVVASVDPEIEIISILSSYLKNKNKGMLFNNISTEEAIIYIYQFLRDIRRIPLKTSEVLDKISCGKTELNINLDKNIKLIDKIDTMINRIAGAVIISALLIASSAVISNKIKPCYKGISIIGIIGYVIAIVFSVILLWNMFKTGLFRIKEKNYKK